MIRRPAPHDDVANEISTRIVESIRPWRIVLFGSRARGDAKEDSDYDIFVEVDPGSRPLREIHGEIWELVAGRGWSIDLKVQPRGAIERRRDDPGTIEWDVAREGILLYADPAAPTVLKPPGRVREPSPEPPESVAEWLETAQKDLRLCQHLIEINDDYWSQICWLSHQTCEKHMKALLVARHVRPKRTHDLAELLAALQQAGCLMPGLDADCELLTAHAITPRYTAGLDLGEDDAHTAFAAAVRVVAAVQAHLPPRIH